MAHGKIALGGGAHNATKGGGGGGSAADGDYQVSFINFTLFSQLLELNCIILCFKLLQLVNFKQIFEFLYLCL